jgi:hypothetical protein
VPLVTFVQLLSRAPLVDAHHGDTNGPCGFANAKTKIAVVRINIPAFLSCFDDLNDRFEDAFVEVSFLEFAE